MNIKPFPDYYPMITDVLHLLRIPPPYEDERQEAYFVYHRCAGNYNPSRSKFSTYYYHELKFHYQSALRKSKRRKEILTATPPRLPSVHIDHYFIHPGFNDREEKIFTYSMEGYTTEDIASLLAISKSTVLRERKKLRQKLSSYVSFSTD